ncbi:acyltransferase family protein [Paraglaciecola sp.]|uniref:acyltransferase family protein n=1 Tax=Paraglaciecola sp. TaxID=1920173 RepID=UPI00326319D1
MHFRKDINGLRALAVLAVVIFHFIPSLVPGGYAGVDMFFVISGFLMTGIIVTGIEQNNFSILNFYIARANRIIPALAALCLSLLILGAMFLTPTEYQALGKHVASSLTFVSNLLYWQESGYFEALSQSKWLLHTWSLSVEWQFYILFPVFLLITSKITTLPRLKILFLMATVLSVLGSIIANYKWPNASYYLLPTRAWEMLIGGLVYFYPLRISQKSKQALEYLGLTLIIAAFIPLFGLAYWPDYLIFMSVLGTAFIIQANRSNSLLTGNLLFQKIGKWSYSIYLWHWPIVVALSYFAMNGAAIYFGIALSILLGFLSYNLIEKLKFRRQFTNVRQCLTCKPLYMVVIITALGLFSKIEDDSAQKLEYVENIKQLTVNRDTAELHYKFRLTPAFTNNGESYQTSFLCSLDGNKQTVESAIDCLQFKLQDSGFLILGDSHGRDFLHAVKLAYPETNFAMLLQSACVPATYSHKTGANKQCFEMLDEIIEQFVLKNHALKGIIFASAYGDDDGIESLLSDIDNKVYGDIPLYLVNAGFVLDNTVVDLASEASVVKDEYKLAGNDQKARTTNELLSEIKGVKVFDKHAAFCKEDLCRLNDGLTPLVWDTAHLSQRGIDIMAATIKEQNFLETQ